ncbi:MAG: contractile injection system tape measure protein [Bacteroidota bacterium]
MSDTGEDHIILRQKFDLEFTDRALAREIQQFVSDEFQGISRALERAMERLDIDPELVIRLDHLEIDLGEWSVEDFKRELVYALERAIYQALAQRIGRLEIRPGIAASEQDGKLVPAAARWEAFIHFLRYGVPSAWWQNRGNMESLLVRLLREPPAVWNQRIRPLLKQPAARRRLIQTASSQHLKPLQAVLFPKQTDAIEQLWETAMKGYQPAGARLPRDLFGLYVRHDLLMTAIESDYQVTTERFTTLLRTRIQKQAESHPAYKQLLIEGEGKSISEVQTQWEAISSEPLSAFSPEESISPETSQDSPAEESGIAREGSIAEINGFDETPAVDRYDTTSEVNEPEGNPEIRWQRAWDALQKGLLEGFLPWWIGGESWASLVRTLKENPEKWRTYWADWVGQLSQSAQKATGRRISRHATGSWRSWASWRATRTYAPRCRTAS